MATIINIIINNNHINTNDNGNNVIIKILKMVNTISWDIASQTESCHDAKFVAMASSFTTNNHYSDVIMRTMASLITSLTIVYSTVYSGADLRKHQSSASLALVWGILPVTGEFTAQMASNVEKCFHLMKPSWRQYRRRHDNSWVSDYQPSGDVLLVTSPSHRHWWHCTGRTRHVTSTSIQFRGCPPVTSSCHGGTGEVCHWRTSQSWRKVSLIYKCITHIMITSWHRNDFRIAGILWGESSCHRWTPQRASDADLKWWLSC